MMYIEQAPLGGNLLKILKSDSLSNGTATKVTSVVNDFRLPNGNCKAEFPLQGIAKRKFHEIEEPKRPKYSLTAQEGEEDEQFELFDIVDESDNLDSEQKNRANRDYMSNGYEIEIDLNNSLKDTSTIKECRLNGNNDNDNDNGSDGDGEAYELRIVRIPKRQVKNKGKAGFTVIKPKPKYIPPVPAAIPIDSYRGTANKRLLNGISSRQLAEDIYELKHQSKLAETSEYSSFESGLGYRPYKDILTRDEQMGILGGIRSFFNWKSRTAETDTSETQVGKRRRSTELLSTNDHFKYRKVENNFPKIITHNLDDEISTAYRGPLLNTQRNFGNIPNLVHPIPSSFEMNQGGLEKRRRSWFKTPQTTNKVVRNNYADIEFSDDDDDEESRRFQESLGIKFEPLSYRTQTKVINIPIRLEQNPTSSMAPLKSSIPSSSTLSRDYVTANTLFNIGPMSKAPYAEALKYNAPFCFDMIQSNSSIGSSGSATSLSRFGKGLSNLARLNTKSLGGSIILKEREIEEHAKYKQLLETINRAQSSDSNILKSSSSSKKQRFAMKYPTPICTPRAPLSSTINIDDDDGQYDGVTITGVTHLKPPKKIKRELAGGIPTIILDEDDDISEIIELNKEQLKKKPIQIIDLDAKENKNDLPFVEPVNSFREKINIIPHLREGWLQSFNAKWEERRKLREAELNKTREITDKLTAERRVAESELQERLQDFRIVDPELIVVDDFAEPEIEEEPEFPELTDERQERIKAAICGPPDQVLVEKFNMNITRRDIQTLLGHNWLNDEVINFYMNLIRERSELKHESHGYPKVYAMNTFFLQRLAQNGHGGVKRWTRKVDIFEMDVIPVPVHVGGVHWCMAIIHLKNRWIRYYDSMGAPNSSVLKLLEQYLKDESLDKRKQPFDTSDFVIESVGDVPRQMNGSDCGVFSCMFAEYVTRNKEITFSQQHMEYFRHKMILEIVQGELLL